MLFNTVLFTGNANAALAQDIATHLSINLGKAKVARFSDGEVDVEIEQNVRARDIFVVQPTCTPTNENLMELCIMVDALKRASARRVTAVMPYFGYARQDRRPRSTRVPISAKVVANMLEAVGVERLLTMDLHADQIQGFFNIPVDNIYASPVLLSDLQSKRYDDLVVVSTPAQLIADGFLVEPRVFTVRPSELPDLSGVRTRRGDYDERALAAAVDRQPLVGNIVEHWLRLADGRRTVAFAVSVEHSRHIAERFREAGIAAEHLDGTTTPLERDAILRRLERGETRVVSNCGVLCEGWDQPSVKCCILARPTKSVGLYLQQAGRILRPWRDTSGDAVSAVVLDHAGCAVTHGLPQDERALSLESLVKSRTGRKSVMPPRSKSCDECGAALPPSTRVCSGCGFAFGGVESVPDENESTLVEVPRASTDAKRAAWDALCAKAARLALKHAWAVHRYREQFGTAPPRAFPKVPEAPETPSSAELVEWDL